ncbi:MAG: hypothetical protein GY795_06050 [Desulfobacterales bacterium]|nr:hypothetical protein [Desulfobacterales bacterium]
MNQSKFEQLSRSLLTAMNRVKDEESLLHMACILLNAEVAVLLQRGYAIDQRYARLSYPLQYKSQLEANSDNLWNWYSSEEFLENSDGFTKEGPLKFAEKKFPDALVAFGKRLPSNGLPRHEMILLKKIGDEEPYRSYHSWAAASLLRQFELYNLENDLHKETQLKEQYAASLTLEELHNISWEALNERIRMEKDSASKIRWPCYAIWTGYQIRKQAPIPWTEEWLENELNKDGKETKQIYSIFRDVILFLTDDLNEQKSIELLEKLKEILQHVESSPWSEIEVQSWYQMLSLFLEHAWRNLRLYTSSGGIKGRLSLNSSQSQEEKLSMKSASKLLQLTRGLVIRELTSCKPDKEGEKGFQELGRNFLRLYLTLEIAKPDSRIEQLYLGGKMTVEHRKAPAELKRTFILNLSRFMLSVVSLVQERLDISNQPPVVSSSEEIDSLLYLIDRFVHVELEVDERLNIREHLSRQIAVEVHQHLTRPHYRDHLLHVIDVFLLGHLLLNTRLCWIQGKETPLVEHLVNLASQRKKDEAQPTLEKEWIQNWAVASLLHDIGYQLGHGKSISREPDVWRRYFELTGPVSPQWLQFQYDEKDAPGADGLFNFAGDLTKNICEQITECLPHNAKNFKSDHGVLSALRVSQILSHAYYQNQPGNEADTGKPSINYKHAIHAIAHHNLCHHKISFDSHPLSCLLRLCDELQEWDRHRVNIEKVVKHLYLDLQKGGFEDIPTYQMFKSFKANLCFKPSPSEGFPESVIVSLAEKEHWFKFILIYHDSTKAHFDPTMTLLCKAYNLQRLDIAVSDQGCNDLKFSIDLRFPSPDEYGEITEYDIYGLFTEKIRSLPLLREFDSIEKAEPGLIRLIKSNNMPRGDRFGIIVTRAAAPGHRHGWLSLDPANFFGRFSEFKNDVLLPISGKI